MSRDTDAIIIEKWGSGAGATHFRTPTDEGFAIVDGWPVSYGTPGSGDEPPREVFNWFWRLSTAMFVELNTRGVLEWNSGLAYVHPAAVMGSDGMLYQSVQDSTNEEPTTDNGANWQQVGITLDDAAIKAAYERNADTNALTDALLTMLQGAAPTASPTFTGAVIVPDQTGNTNNGRAANTRFVQAAVAALAPLANPILTGNPRAPTPLVGDNDTSIATTEFVASAVAALVASAPGTLNTLNELAAALGDDPNFATTVMDQIAAGSIRAGTMLDFAGDSAPSGYLLCDGQAVSRSTYSVLFAVIGTTWGVGDNDTTFNVPDMQRRVAVGSGGSGTDTLGNSAGDTGGAEQHTLTVDELPSHTHPFTVYRSHAGTDNLVDAIRRSGTRAAGADTATGATGGGGAHNNLQPSAVVTKIIKT